tara:strand:- start:361 stop:612 length:252 start_codon:yes stop_codon:yes gene_type:complete
MYKDKLGVPSEHTLNKIKSSNEQHGGRDTDIYSYEEKNTKGVIIATYVVNDSTSIYPPQSRTVLFYKYDLNGDEIKSGTMQVN